MHPRIQELLDHLDTQRAVLRQAVDSVPVAFRDRRPADGRWSVAEVLDHLANVEGRIAKRVRLGIEEGSAKGVAAEPDTSPILATFNGAAAVDRGSPISAPEPTRPTTTADHVTAWAALEGSGVKLRAALVAGDGLALGTLIYPHPVFGPYSLYDWVAFAGFHEARHADQIREIGAQLEGT